MPFGRLGEKSRFTFAEAYKGQIQTLAHVLDPLFLLAHEQLDLGGNRAFPSVFLEENSPSCLEIIHLPFCLSGA